MEVKKNMNTILEQVNYYSPYWGIVIPEILEELSLSQKLTAQEIAELIKCINGANSVKAEYKAPIQGECLFQSKLEKLEKDNRIYKEVILHMSSAVGMQFDDFVQCILKGG